MGLLDSLFQSGNYGGQGGGLLDFLRTSQMQQANYQPSAGFGSDGQLQANPIGVGDYQMPRIGGMAQFTPDPAAIPQNAQPAQGQLPMQQQPQALPPALGGSGQSSPGFGDRLNAGALNFANAGGLLPALVGGISGLATGQRNDAQGIAQQNLKAQYDALVPTLGPQKAMLAVMNPEAGKILLEQSLSNKEKWADIGTDQYGNPQKGFVNERDQTVNGKPVTAQPTQQNGFGDPTLTGDAYMQSLPAAMQSQVKAIVEGRMQPPSGFALKSPQIQALMRAASQYEPGFDLTKWSARAGTAKDFASGAAAKNVTSLNTVVGHLADLKEKAEALDNYRFPIVNEVVNAYGNATGKPEVNNFNLARNAVADELAKVFKGSGISDHEIAQWKGTLNTAQSPDQLKGAVLTAIGLMESRLVALNDQRDRGMSTQSEPRSLLNEKSKKGLASIEEWASGTGKTETKAGGIQEGATATNPQTGAKITFRNGKWQ